MKKIIASSIMCICCLAVKAQPKFKPTHRLPIYDTPNYKSTPFDSIDHDDYFYVGGYINAFWYGMQSGKYGYIFDKYGDYIPFGESQENMDTFREIGNVDTAKANLLFRQILKKENAELVHWRATVQKGKNAGFLIIATPWGYTNEYSGFVDIDLRFTNYSSKTIKYVYAYVSAWNPVNDLISYQGKTSFKMTAVGPVSPNSDALYTFKDVFYSNIVDKVKVTRVQIVYMDNTTKTILKPTYEFD